MRFSNGSSKRDAQGKFVPDATRQGDDIVVTSDIRGMAVKVLGVTGEMVPEAAGRTGEQDLIMINSPVFFIRNVVDYLVFFKVMAAIAKGTINFKAQPPLIPAEDVAAVQQVKYALDLVGKIQNSEAGVVHSPLQTTFWSATPYKLGEAAMKYKMVPVTPEPRFDPSQSVDLENLFRDAISSQLARTEAQFDLLVQVQTDATEMPIEDPTKLWEETSSPYVKVATLRLPQQDINSPDRLAEDEHQSFSPWHSLAAHRPLGGVNRARRMYGHLAQERNKDNQAG
ncbi:MAG: catalase [Cyanobacteria bacterium K_Offshore_surface_m2_239]|nr:catalase [Cyanobacteria bacterium K_Offshore_surface_m2_239]